MTNKANWQPWVWIKWKPNTPTSAWEGWRNNPKVKNAWNTMGDWDCVLWLNVSTPDELEEFVWKTVRSNEWVQDTNSNWTKQWW